MKIAHTKIVCTLGPATDPPGIIESMIGAGMNVARMNLSHGTHDDHTRRIRRVREASRALGEPVGILADLPGPKFRVGELLGGTRELRDGARVFLAGDASAPDEIPIRQPELLRALNPGETVYLADGSIELRIAAVSAGRAECEVVVGGALRSGAGINLPDSDLPGLLPTPRDRIELAYALSQAVEWIGVSFVQCAEDLARVRACLPSAGGPLLVAKIEKRRALSALDAIIEAADAIMVARGDLGVETDLAEIPLVQKRIIAAANARSRPVITATQMLESMVEHDHPTRAEVTDVANAVLDGTDAVMLSAESAVGRHPVAAVHFLRRIVSATQQEYSSHIARARLQAGTTETPDEAIAFAAAQLAGRLDARAIVLHVGSVPAAARLARFRPQAPIVALTQSERLFASLTLVSGVSPILAERDSDTRAHVDQAARWLHAHGLARPGDRIVMLSASAGASNAADTLRVIDLPG